MQYRVIQWATGAMGKTCLRAVIDHPDLVLAGLYVYSESKAGRDAGEIAGRAPTGVIATRSVNEILALEADVVIHAPRIQPPYTHHNEMICRLLTSGKNVISINGHTFPAYWGEAAVEPFETACRSGESTLFGTGLNPGFIVEKIATTATGLCNRIDHIFIGEVVACNSVKNPNYVFDVLGFGTPVGSIDPNDPTWAPAEILNGMYSEVVAHLVARMGYRLDRVETDHVMLPATTDIQTAAGLIKQGTIGHTNWRWHAVVDDKRLVTLSIAWIMETAHLENPDQGIWNVKISGLPEVKIHIDLKNPDDYPYRTEPEQLAVAASVVNSIPSVCHAKPGIMDIPVANHFRIDF
jgi:2,4-diaminopentanoate dehydrogenase